MFKSKILLVVPAVMLLNSTGYAGQSKMPTNLELSMVSEVKNINYLSSKNSSSINKGTNSSLKSNKAELPDLEVRFGSNGEPFLLHLYDNDTALEIARDVGASDWNLPIYHFDDFDNSDVMQYYDIPSRYEYTSNPETITSEKAGEVYYSEPNRIVLFYNDTEVKGEYTKIGYIEATDEFKKAVEENPVIPGWGNKIVSISRADTE